MAWLNGGNGVGDDDDAEKEEELIDRWSNEEGECVIDGEAEADEKWEDETGCCYSIMTSRAVINDTHNSWYKPVLNCCNMFRTDWHDWSGF